VERGGERIAVVLRWITAGESHGPALVAVLEGMVAGVEITTKELAAELARRKALAAPADEHTLILGSDQVLTLDGRREDKSKDRSAAFALLRRLAGRDHQLHSAAVIVEKGQAIWSAIETARLSMRTLSDAAIESYLDREYDDVRSSLGHYHIEGRGVQLFDRIEGSYFAILGLPLLPLLQFLRRRGVIPV